MSALNNAWHTSSTPAAFPGFALFNAPFNSCNHHLLRPMFSISSNSTISSSSKGFVGSSLFNISLKRSTHLCSLSRVSVLSTPCLSLTPVSCFRLSPVIDLVMLYSSLLLPFSVAFSAAAALFSITNFSYLPLHSVSLRCSSHYTPLSISVLVVPILQCQFASFLSFDLFPYFFPIHGLPSFFDIPTASPYVAKIISCSPYGSSMSPKASNLFLTSMLYLLLISSLSS